MGYGNDMLKHVAFWWNGDLGTLNLAFECFKWGLMDPASRRIEDNDAEGELNCKGIAQEVSEWKIIMM